MMIKPSIDQLTNGGEINRYELVIATSKVARVITDEYCVQRERAEAMIRNGETDKSLAKDDKRIAILNLKTTALLWLVGVIASGIVALVFKIYLGG